MAAPVLLVADDLDLIASVKRALGLHGIEVVLAASAADAIIAYGQHTPSLVVMQPSVEDDRGAVVLKELRTHPQSSQLRVLLLGERVPGFIYRVEPLPFDAVSFAKAVDETRRVDDPRPSPPETWRTARLAQTPPALEDTLFGDLEEELHREVEAQALATLDSSLPLAPLASGGAEPVVVDEPVTAPTPAMAPSAPPEPAPVLAVAQAERWLAEARAAAGENSAEDERALLAIQRQLEHAEQLVREERSARQALEQHVLDLESQVSEAHGHLEATRTDLADAESRLKRAQAEAGRRGQELEEVNRRGEANVLDLSERIRLTQRQLVALERTVTASLAVMGEDGLPAEQLPERLRLKLGSMSATSDDARLALGQLENEVRALSRFFSATVSEEQTVSATLAHLGRAFEQAQIEAQALRDERRALEAALGANAPVGKLTSRLEPILAERKSITATLGLTEAAPGALAKAVISVIGDHTAIAEERQAVVAALGEQHLGPGVLPGRVAPYLEAHRAMATALGLGSAPAEAVSAEVNSLVSARADLARVLGVEAGALPLSIAGLVESQRTVAAAFSLSDARADTVSAEAKARAKEREALLKLLGETELAVGALPGRFSPSIEAQRAIAAAFNLSGASADEVAGEAHARAEEREALLNMLGEQRLDIGALPHRVSAYVEAHHAIASSLGLTDSSPSEVVAGVDSLNAERQTVISTLGLRTSVEQLLPSIEALAAERRALLATLGLQDADASLGTVADVVAALVTDRAAVFSEIGFQPERGELPATAPRVRERLATLSADLAALQAERDAATISLAQLQHELKTARATGEATSDELAVAGSRLTDLESAVAQGQAMLSSLEAERTQQVAELEHRLALADEHFAQVSARLEAVELAREALSAQLERITSERDAYRDRSDGLEGRLQAVSGELEGTKTRAEEAEASAQLAGEKVRLLESRAVMSLSLPGRQAIGVPRHGNASAEMLARLMTQLVLAQAEVRLELGAPGGTRRLWLAKGLVVAAESTLPYETLVDRARRDGLIDGRQEAELRVLRGAPAREQLEVLKARGFIREIEAVPLVQRFTEAVTLEALCERETNYRLVDGAPDIDVLAATVPRSTLPLVAEAIRRALPGDELLESLGGGEAVPVPQESDLDLRALGFSERERKMVSWIDGEATIEDVCLASGLKPDAAYRALAVARALGVLEVRPADTRRAVAPADLELRRLEAKFDEVQDADYFTILGLPRSAGIDDVRRAAERLSEEFDPLKFSGHSDASLQARAQVVSALIDEAARALGDERRRAEYARHLLD